MRRSELADLAAMGLSVACMLHCLAVPLLLVAAPWIVPAFFGDEAFHVVAVTLVIPVSLIALAGSAALRPGLVALAAVGVLLLLSAIFAPSPEAKMPNPLSKKTPSEAVCASPGSPPGR